MSCLIMLSENRERRGEIKMRNNETVKKFDITIKLRGDNVYDLYMNGEWVASRGSCDNIVCEVGNIIRETLFND